MELQNLTDIQLTYITAMLLAKAFEKDGFEIATCNGYTTFNSGLMFYNESVYLYYNVIETKSTHLVKISEKELNMCSIAL